MLWTYEDGDYNSSVSMEIDSDDIKYDAEYMNIFMEQLTDDVKWYVDRARALEKSYVKYHNNETFVGQMAEYSKRFIYEIQGDELHIKNLELKKDFLYACSNIEERFKEQVDPSPKSRISTRVLLKIKRDFGTYYAVIDTKGYEIECHAKRLVDMYGKWGISTVPCYRRSMMTYEEFCGNSAFLDTCIKKLENFDQESCSVLNGKDFIGNAQTLQAKINNTAGVLDSMTVYQPNVAKNSVGLVSLSVMGAVKNNPLDGFKKLIAMSKNRQSDPVVITDPKYLETMQKEFGFTEEEATLLYAAYEKFEKKYPTKTGKGWNDLKIKKFYSNLAALYPGYSSEDALFEKMLVTPSPRQAVAFFNSLGVDGEALKKALNDQHSTCEKNVKRDFVHECAIFAIMAEHNGTKELGEDVTKMLENIDSDKNLPFLKKKGIYGVSEDIDAMIGYKGDVYSGSMGIDDKKSDIAAYNIYYRMRNSKNENIWETMTKYNEGVSEEKINGSKEFLAHFGNGDSEKGMEALKIDLDKETNGTRKLGGDPKKVKAMKREFLEYISDESGVDWE